MRLIDAEALRKNAETCRETTDAFCELIDSAPTMDAIPVGWLRDKQHVMELADRSRPFAQMIDSLIRVWYKEQRGEYNA